MKIKINEYNPLPFHSRKFYGVVLDDDVEIETLVTHDPAMVKSWIDSIENMHRCRLHRLIVGLDVEWRAETLPNCVHPAATLQLCVGKSCLIFQIHQARRIPNRLRKFLEDPDYTFVGVGIKYDIKKLRKDYGLEVANTRDLRYWAADEMDRKEVRRFSLKRLVKEIFGEDIDKPRDVIMSKWDERVLSEAQVAYACLDAYFSFGIGRLLSSWY